MPDLSIGSVCASGRWNRSTAPHAEDEVYYVISGAGMIRVGDEDRPVQGGSIVYVEEKGSPSFSPITENLSILVFFAPARE